MFVTRNTAAHHLPAWGHHTMTFYQQWGKRGGKDGNSDSWKEGKKRGKEGKKRGIPHSPSSWSKRGEINRNIKGESSLEKAWNSSTQKEGKKWGKEGKIWEKRGIRGGKEGKRKEGNSPLQKRGNLRRAEWGKCPCMKEVFGFDGKEVPGNLVSQNLF